MIALMAPGPMEIVFIGLFSVLFVWPVCRIVGKAGFHPLLGLLVLVPIGNIALLLFLAFAEWPALRDKQNEREDND